MVIGIILSFVAVIAVIALDAAKKINLMAAVPLFLYFPVALNLVLLGWWLYTVLLVQYSVAAMIFCSLPLGLLILYWWLRLNIFPVRDGHKTGPRLKAMIGGRFIALRSVWAVMLEGILLLIFYPILSRNGVPTNILVINGVYALLLLLFLLANGTLRMFCTSRRLSIIRRVILLFTWWIPVVNLFVLGYVSRLVSEEYDYALYKANLNQTRVESDLCRTRYPLVMVHGVFFHDLRYFNYWGRIPKELIRQGATVYYGNQEAVGTIAYNAEDIRKKIFQVMEETGAEKVNIIAHSEGGLDARYAISTLEMGDYVASLTTMGSPHHGGRYMDFAVKLPEKVYRFIAKIFDNTFRRMGDKSPDFYNATRAFLPAISKEFNQEVPDSPGVYYQSFASKMNHPFSEPLLAFPYLFTKPLEGDNDGLVSVESSKWGNYRGLLVSKGFRGVSHADMIDLKRQDYKGFDIVETYVQIVAELKKMGY
ncbi:MAG: esterase/lipase family protein [Oscillospiraceae bacterium]